jgi:hypothetical protein
MSLRAEAAKLSMSFLDSEYLWYMMQFAIRYNRRGIATQEENGCKGSQLVLGRMDCIHVVTDAVVEAASQPVVVDLETPQVGVTSCWSYSYKNSLWLSCYVASYY